MQKLSCMIALRSRIAGRPTVGSPRERPQTLVDNDMADRDLARPTETFDARTASGPRARKRIPLLLPALALMASAGSGLTTAADWPEWRGPSLDGSAPSGTYPVRWDPSGVTWKAELPGKGCSTPIVWKRRIYLTAAAGGQDAVLAFDWDGRRLWQTTLGPEKAGKHRNGSGSNPSPVTDGSGIFVFYKSGRLAALEPDGSIRWRTDIVERFGPDERFWDVGTSPTLTRESLILARMHDGDSWLAAFDKESGRLRWKVARDYETPVEGRQSYTTPIVFRRGAKEVILVWGAHHLTAHDASDGSVIWWCGGFNPEARRLWPAVASPVIAGDVAVVPCGRSDRGEPRLHGIRLGGTGDVTATHRLWVREDTGGFVPSPSAHRGRVYVLRDRGEICCLDPATGKDHWSDRLPRGRGSFYASPLIAGGHLYAVRENGELHVARVADGLEPVAEVDLGERVIASPIALENRLLIRSERYLFCVASGSP